MTSWVHGEGSAELPNNFIQSYTHSVNVVCMESAMARWTIKILQLLQ